MDGTSRLNIYIVKCSLVRPKPLPGRLHLPRTNGAAMFTPRASMVDGEGSGLTALIPWQPSPPIGPCTARVGQVALQRAKKTSKMGSLAGDEVCEVEIT